MPKVDRDHVRALLQVADTGSTDKKGRALEDLVIYLFEASPGVELDDERVLDEALSQEIDVIFRNNREKRGLHDAPPVNERHRLAGPFE